MEGKDSTICPISSQSSSEEIANALTHGVGLALSAIGFVVLLFYAGRLGTWHIFGCGVYGLSLLMLYGASTSYHFCRSRALKRTLQRLDHICIYILIAGSYTPIMMLVLRGGLGWSLLGIVWGLALVGIILKIIFGDRFLPLAIGFYLAMGWLSMVAIVPLYQALPFGAFVLFIAGGLSYTVGVAFFAWEKMPFNHALWHLFVIAGSATHFFAILFSLRPFFSA